MADIQAVVAADYIRNLREEARRGIAKRFAQGMYPLGAPIGYLNSGSGKAKRVDAARANFIRLAFNWYASGGGNLDHPPESVLCGDAPVEGQASAETRSLFTAEPGTTLQSGRPEVGSQT